MSVGARLLVVALLASGALVATYVALGGTSYRPTPVANPCDPRESTTLSTPTEAIQRVVLVAADQVACTLGTTREDLVLALRSADDLEALARRQGLDRDSLEQTVRVGLVRAVDAAVRDSVIGERTASLVRAAAEHLPIGLLLTLLRGIDSLVGAD
jgi:hypothetical protein